MPHVDEAKWADVVVLAPATCNSIGKLASGVSDSIALLIVRTLPRGRKVIAVPSMHTEMWFDPQLQRNIDLLNATEKYRVICPTRGEMLSGDFGFGAQAGIEVIVAETYRALGIVDPTVAAALRTTRTLPWEAAGGGEDADRRVVAVVEEDASLRSEIVAALTRALPDVRLFEFATASQALAWAPDFEPSVVITELDFSSGATGFDLIHDMRSPGSQGRVEVIVMSARPRHEVGAERLARDEVLFQPKPLNVPFLVGMVAGCVGTEGRRTPRVAARTLERGEVLLREGDPGSSIYVVQFGRLRVERKSDGRSVVVGSVGPGELAGEIAYLRKDVRSATLVADVPTSVLELNLDDVRDYLDAQPSWLRLLIESLIEHVHHSDEAMLKALHSGAPGQ